MASNSAESASRVAWKYQNFIIAGTLLVLGLLTLIAGLLISSTSFWGMLLLQVSTALLVSGIWSALYDFTLRRSFIAVQDEMNSKVLQRITCSEAEEVLGLVEALDNSATYNYTRMLLESQEFLTLMNDGRTWVSLNNDSLKRRFADPKKKTFFFVLHPNSPMLEVLARATGVTVASLQEKIGQTIHMLRQVENPETRLVVYGHYLWNPSSVFIGEDNAVVTTYFASRGRKTVPLFRYENRGETSLYRRLRDDLSTLTLDAEELYRSPAAAAAGDAP